VVLGAVVDEQADQNHVRDDRLERVSVGVGMNGIIGMVGRTRSDRLGG
jgi:hypothetical protein